MNYSVLSKRYAPDKLTNVGPDFEKAFLEQLEKFELDKDENGDYKCEFIVSISCENLKQCEHPHNQLKFKIGADTGNYDPSEDCYWIDVTCKKCGMFESFDSHEDSDDYRKYTSLKYLLEKTYENK